MNKLKTEEWIAIIVAILLGALAFVYLGNNNQAQTNQQLNNVITNNTDFMSENGLEVTTTTPGQGPAAEEGDVVIVNYRGRLAENNEEFDNSYDRGQPFPVILGMGQVIQGWELGLLGAQAGESRTLFIPAELGYGETGTPGGPIPPDADLIFDIEVLQVIPADEVETSTN